MRKTNALVRVATALLSDVNAPHWGYELSRSSGVRSGVMYPILARMLEHGWLSDGWETNPESRPPRRYYRVTDEGRKQMETILAAGDRAHQTNRVGSSTELAIA